MLETTINKVELATVSYTVRGLTSRTLNVFLRAFLHETHFNVCFLQEHKVCQHELPLLGESIWKDGHFLFTVAQDEIHIACNGLVPTKPPKKVSLTNDILDSNLDFSLTIGLKGVDVCKLDIEKLNRLLHNQCLFGLAALERGDTKNHLHFQMVYRACIKLAFLFGILTHKYMGWYAVSGEDESTWSGMLQGLNKQAELHTFQGMIGYYLKDIGTKHFDVVAQHIRCRHHLGEDSHMPYLVDQTLSIMLSAHTKT